MKDTETETRNEQPCFPKEIACKLWNAYDIVCALQFVQRLEYHIPEARDGILDAKRGEAAHNECKVFFKSFMVLHALTEYAIIFSPYHKTPPNWELLHPIDVLVGGPSGSYIEHFAKYLHCFADKWFDTEQNRTEYFDLITEAFSRICQFILLYAGIGETDRADFNHAVGYFIEQFRQAARFERPDERKLHLAFALDAFPDVQREFVRLGEKAREGVDKAHSTYFPSLAFANEDEFEQELKHYSDRAEKLGTELLERVDDRRPEYVLDDTRYGQLPSLLTLWHAMPNSIVKFCEVCKLLEQAALVATEFPCDYGFSCYPWLYDLLRDLSEHPKQKSAKSILDFEFTEDEQTRMSVAFKNMGLAFLRLRQRLRAESGSLHADPDSCDDFFAFLPKLIGDKTLNYRKLLFEDGNAKNNDGYNGTTFLGLTIAAQKTLKHVEIPEALMADASEVNKLLKRAFSTGNRLTIDETCAKLLKKYFKKSVGSRRQRTAPVVIEEEHAPARDDFTMAEPGLNDKEQYRFSIAPKFERIVDMMHRGEPYRLSAYEGLTAPAAIAVLKQLFNAIGRKDGWIKPPDKWRFAFKSGVYHRFKIEQIEVGTKANLHHGYIRLIPNDLFQEITRAMPVK